MRRVPAALTPGRRVRLPLSLRKAPLTLSFMVGLRFWWWTSWWWVVRVVRVVVRGLRREKMPRRRVVVVWCWRRRVVRGMLMVVLWLFWLYGLCKLNVFGRFFDGRFNGCNGKEVKSVFRKGKVVTTYIYSSISVGSTWNPCKTGYVVIIASAGQTRGNQGWAYPSNHVSQSTK